MFSWCQIEFEVKLILQNEEQMERQNEKVGLGLSILCKQKHLQCLSHSELLSQHAIFLQLQTSL